MKHGFILILLTFSFTSCKKENGDFDYVDGYYGEYLVNYKANQSDFMTTNYSIDTLVQASVYEYEIFHGNTYEIDKKLTINIFGNSTPYKFTGWNGLSYGRDGTIFPIIEENGKMFYPEFTFQEQTSGYHYHFSGFIEGDSIRASWGFYNPTSSTYYSIEGNKL